MGIGSFWHILIVAVVVILLFGRGKISDLMGDVAKGIKSFKKGMSEDETAGTPPTGRTISHAPGDPLRTETVDERTKAS